MSLPCAVIDRLFKRLAATYGAAWDRALGAAPVADVKTAWGHELAGFGGDEGLQAIAWALAHLPERCPNAIEFRNLCRQAPAPDRPALAPPPAKADPDRVRAEFARLADLRERLGQPVGGERLDWARRILARRDSGAKVSPTVAGMAADALAGRCALPQGRV